MMKTLNLAAVSGRSRRSARRAAMPQSPAIATHAQRGGSWMLPETQSIGTCFMLPDG